MTTKPTASGIFNGLIVFLLCITMHSKAQIVKDSVSMGTSYTNQVFYSLDNGEVLNINNNDWDIAFSASGAGATGSAIILNEATTTLWAYPKGDTSAWSTFDTTNYKTWERLLNTDTSWTNGAFNVHRGAAGTFDMGWGILNPSNNYWTFGDSLYLVKLSNATFKKLRIVSLKSGTWAYRYADLDGTNEQNFTIAKSNYPKRNFVYHSILTNQIKDREPNNDTWDLMFVKNVDYTPSTNPALRYTSVSSVFSNVTVRSTKTNAINYAAATALDTPSTAYTTRINNMGREWKYYKSSTGKWIVYDSIAYFVYSNDSSSLYRIIYKSFGGSSNGKTVFEKTKLVIPENKDTVPTILSIAHLNKKSNFIIYPNPANEKLTLLIDYPKSEAVTVDILTATGEKVFSKNISLASGLSQTTIPLGDLKRGIYIVNVKGKTFVASQKLIVE